MGNDIRNREEQGKREVEAFRKANPDRLYGLGMKDVAGLCPVDFLETIIEFGNGE